jgi:hypothetical protein
LACLQRLFALHLVRRQERIDPLANGILNGTYYEMRVW